MTAEQPIEKFTQSVVESIFHIDMPEGFTEAEGQLILQSQKFNLADRVLTSFESHQLVEAIRNLSHNT